MINLLAAALIAAAHPAPAPSCTVTVEIAGRKGSTRVGGTGSSGKGSHYVGGQKSKKSPPTPKPTKAPKKAK